MSKKSILLSILPLILYSGLIIATVFLFKVHFMLGVAGILSLFIPLKIQRKAIDEASAKIDEVFAKYIIPCFLLVAVIFIVLLFTLWI